MIRMWRWSPRRPGLPLPGRRAGPGGAPSWTNDLAPARRAGMSLAAGGETAGGLPGGRQGVRGAASAPGAGFPAKDSSSCCWWHRAVLRVRLRPARVSDFVGGVCNRRRVEITAEDLARIPPGNLRVPRAEFGAVWAAAERRCVEQGERGVTDDWYAGGGGGDLPVDGRRGGASGRSGGRSLAYSPVTAGRRARTRS